MESNGSNPVGPQPAFLVGLHSKCINCHTALHKGVRKCSLAARLKNKVSAYTVRESVHMIEGMTMCADGDQRTEFVCIPCYNALCRFVHHRDNYQKAKNDWSVRKNLVSGSSRLASVVGTPPKKNVDFAKKRRLTPMKTPQLKKHRLANLTTPHSSKRQRSTMTPMTTPGKTLRSPPKKKVRGDILHKAHVPVRDIKM
jgi:hypothetical protein